MLLSWHYIDLLEVKWTDIENQLFHFRVVKGQLLSICYKKGEGVGSNTSENHWTTMCVGKW